MTETPYAYWRRKQEVDVTTNASISGSCRLEQVPSYGEVGTLRIPTAIETQTDANGVMTITSPPIIGASKAYRYRMTLTEADLDAIALMEHPAVESYLRLFTAESPLKGADRANWWWYIHDRFQYAWTSFPKAVRTPTRLMTTWKRGMLELLLAKHPNKEQHLAAWDSRVQAHKNTVARTRMVRTPQHRKSDGDLVVLPFATRFRGGATHQVFEYHIEEASYHQKRTKHSLRVHHTRYIVAHGKAMTFQDGTAPHNSLLPPIRTAMALIAWSRAPMDTAHQKLQGHMHFSALVEQTIQEMEAWIEDTVRMDHVHHTLHEVEAARNAIQCFLSHPKKRDELDMMAQTLASHAQTVQHRLQTVAELCQTVIAQQENTEA